MGVDEAVKELLILCYFFKSKFAITDSIDSALYSFYKKNMKIDGLRTAYKEIDEIVFSSINKYHAKLVRPIDYAIHRKLYGGNMEIWTQTDVKVSQP